MGMWFYFFHKWKFSQHPLSKRLPFPTMPLPSLSKSGVICSSVNLFLCVLDLFNWSVSILYIKLSIIDWKVAILPEF